MITISFHVGTLLVGFLIGFVVACAIFLLAFFGERWSLGFSDGWKCGKEYAERKKEGEA